MTAMTEWGCDKCDTRVKLHPSIHYAQHICGKRNSPTKLKKRDTK